jgi:hypothetical protein
LVDRILRGSAATISFQLLVDGAGADPSPDSARVDVLDSSGALLVDGADATNEPLGKFTLPLEPVVTSALDVLTARWTLTYGGEEQTFETYVEVVGGYLFSLADVRADPDLADEDLYPIDRVIEMRTQAEDALEQACGVAFVPRFRVDTVEARGRIMLARRRPTKIRSIKRDGVALSETASAQLRVRSDGVVLVSRSRYAHYPTCEYEIAYEHGYPFPPAREARAAFLLAKRWLVEQPFDERASKVTTDGGTIDLQIRGAFDIPEVNRVVRLHDFTPIPAG